MAIQSKFENIGSHCVKNKNPYANIPATIWLLATVTLISRSGSMVLVFLPLYLTQMLGFDIILAGQIVSLYGLGQIAGSFSGGMLSDKFGSLKVQTLGFFLVGILYILLEFLSSTITIMFSMFFVGFFMAAIHPATGATIAKCCAPDIRTRAYSLNYQALNLGTAIGPAIGGLLAGINYMWLFRLDGLANIFAAIAVWIFFRNNANNKITHEEADHPSTRATPPWKDKSFLIFLLLVFLIGMCFFQLLNIYPYYLSNDYHLTKIQIGMIMALNGILITIFQMTIASRLRNHNTLRIIGVGGALICLGYCILPWYTGFHYALFSMSIITVGEMLTMPFAFEIITKIAPAQFRGKYLGLLSCALTSVPLWITPTLMPYIYTSFGPATLWTSMGILGVIIFIGIELLNKSGFAMESSNYQ